MQNNGLMTINTIETTTTNINNINLVKSFPDIQSILSPGKKILPLLKFVNNRFFPGFLKKKGLFFKNKSLAKATSETNMETKIKHLKLNKKENIYKNPILAFFNHDFYDNEVPIPKKVIYNKNILDYYLKEKAIEDKYMMQKKNNSLNDKSTISDEHLFPKKEIKDSLRLDDYSIFQRIHKITRFWRRFINYSCPVFLAQKLNLHKNFSKSPKKINNNDYLQKKFKDCFHDRNVRLPKLYTNSSSIYKNYQPKGNIFCLKKNTPHENQKNYNQK